MIARINTTEKRKTAIPSFAELKRRGAKATMITVYDCPFARLVDQTPAELMLVGESLGMVIQGLEHTNPVTLDEVISHVKAVRRGAFDIEPDGSLTRRRIWAQFDDRGFEALDLERTIPDRISLDMEGAIWVASAAGSTKAPRVLEDGVVTDRVKVETQPFAAALGGPNRRILLVCTIRSGETSRGSGRIETVQVDVLGARLP